MKAYRCEHDDGYETFSKFYWAKTRNKAKSCALYDDELGDPQRYLDIQAFRIPWADGLENVSNDDFILECLKHGYSYTAFATCNADVTADDSALITIELGKNDVPVLQKVGSIDNFLKLYTKGKIKFNDNGISYLVSEERKNG